MELAEAQPRVPRPRRAIRPSSPQSVQVKFHRSGPIPRTTTSVAFLRRIAGKIDSFHPKLHRFGSTCESSHEAEDVNLTFLVKKSPVFAKQLQSDITRHSDGVRSSYLDSIETPDDIFDFSKKQRPPPPRALGGGVRA